jgi:periplasmic protein TonB
MFDLAAGRSQHIPRTQTMPMLISTAVQITAGAAIVIVPLLFATDRIPEVPTMMAFVAPPPTPPPPPPPPAPAVARPAKPETVKPPDPAAVVVPIEAPPTLEAVPADDEGFEEPIAEGVPGGVPGGIAGGVIGGLVPDVPSPPPAPPPPPSRTPVRIGGQIQAPALLHRVDPAYPEMATSARLEGIAILEATVDEQGRVEKVVLLRSAHPLLDREASIALKQWRYSPLLLNGRPSKFVLTVTLSFRIAQPKE